MKCVNGVCNRRTGTGLAAAAVMAAMLSQAVPVYAASGIDMSTAYPGIVMQAGESTTFALNFVSMDGEGHDIALSTESIPEGWTGYFRSDSSQVTMVHVSGSGDEEITGEAAEADFSLTVPDDAEEGVYIIELAADAGAGNTDTLELEITVNEEETGKSNFTAEYQEQQGAAGTSFSFDTTIANNRGTNQSYSLAAQAPDGWQVTFAPSGESANVASVDVEADSTQGVTVSVVPPENVEKGDYTISCSAISSRDSLSADLTVTITGTYGISLSTSSGNLSFDAYENRESSVTLSVTNTGNVDLTNLNLTSSAPTDWEVRFDESTIDTLEAGATKEITAYVTPSENVITGDYVTSLSISNDETSSTADFRVTVKTSTTWGIVAVAIIAVLAAGLGYIFKKYGRR